jgi:Fur family transcriptional regulator, ferric uptake regulator
VTERGGRIQTRQRSAVRAALEAAGEFRSAQQLHARLRADGEGVGLATVYRTLQQLADDGDVDVLRTADGEAVYRRCSTIRHHHHLVCRSCGRTVELDAAAVERWARRMGEEHGFSDVDHVVELFGTCRECATTDRHA